MISRPSAAPAHFPYAHRTLAEVDRDEAFIHEKLRTSPMQLDRVTCAYCHLTLRAHQIRVCMRSTCPAKAALR